MHEVWKRQQVHEGARQMHRAQILVNGKSVTLDVMIWYNNGQTGKDADLVQKMFGLCEARSGPEIEELLQAGASRHKRARQND